jgi:outer membrane protein TolC
MPLWAWGQQKLTIKEAINSALTNKKQIQAGKWDPKISQLQTNALYHKYWPQVTVGYNYLYNPILQTSILPIGIFNPAYPADATKSVQFGTRWSQTAGVTVYQPIVDVSVSRQISEARVQERIAEARQTQTEYELAYSVAQVYTDIQLQETKITSAVADTNRTWASYRLLQHQYDEKRLLKTTLNKAKVNHNNAVQQYKKAVSQLIENKVFLLYLMGKSDTTYTHIALDTTLWPVAAMNTKDLPMAANNLPEVQQLQLKEVLTDAQAQKEKTKYLPTLGVKGFIGANQFANSFDPFAPNSWFGQSYVGIDLKYPIFAGDDRRRKLQELQYQKTQYGLEKEDMLARYAKDAAIASIRMNEILTDMKLQEENITLAKESVALFQARVAEGLQLSADLNTEEADLQQIQATYDGNKRQYALYFLDYLKTSGHLDRLWK